MPSLLLAFPKELEHWSFTTLREKLIKIGAQHRRYVTFQMGRHAGGRRAGEGGPGRLRGIPADREGDQGRRAGKFTERHPAPAGLFLSQCLTQILLQREKAPTMQTPFVRPKRMRVAGRQPHGGRNNPSPHLAPPRAGLSFCRAVSCGPYRRCGQLR